MLIAHLMNPTKNGMLPIQPLCGRQCYEELGTICVGTANKIIVEAR